jgi:single-strand DNA-binding protein
MPKIRVFHMIYTLRKAKFHSFIHFTDIYPKHNRHDKIISNVNGKNVINFTVAHTERYKDAQGNQKDKTTWVDCAYWTDRTGIAPYLKKGTQVYVEGTPDVRTYTTQDGRNGATLSVRVASVQLLGAKPSEGGSAPQSAPSYGGQSSAPAAGDMNESDDLPF